MSGPLQSAKWADGVHSLFMTHRINLVAFVPDGGQKRLIALCQADATMRTVTLTTGEEGIALAAGASLGGSRAADAVFLDDGGVGAHHSTGIWSTSVEVVVRFVEASLMAFSAQQSDGITYRVYPPPRQ